MNHKERLQNIERAASEIMDLMSDPKKRVDVMVAKNELRLAIDQLSGAVMAFAKNAQHPYWDKSLDLDYIEEKVYSSYKKIKGEAPSYSDYK